MKLISLLFGILTFLPNSQISYAIMLKFYLHETDYIV